MMAKTRLAQAAGALFVTAFVGIVLVGAQSFRQHRVETGSPSEAAATSPGTPPPTFQTVQSPVPAGPLVGPDGKSIMLNPPDPGYVPPVSGEAAVEAASKHIGTTAGPASITARLAVFGDGDPVWVVTFDGICTAISDGPPSESLEPCPITKESAIISATTGEWTSNYWGPSGLDASTTPGAGS